MQDALELVLERSADPALAIEDIVKQVAQEQGADADKLQLAYDRLYTQWLELH